jgi:hypothetical protein
MHDHCAMDYVEERIRALELKRKALNERVDELRNTVEILREDLEWLNSVGEGERKKVFKDFIVAAGDIWEELMDVMVPLDEGAFDRCMSVIYKSPNCHYIATEFTRSCPQYMLKKTEVEFARVIEESISVTNHLNGMYEHGMRALDSLEVSTSLKL